MIRKKPIVSIVAGLSLIVATVLTVCLSFGEAAAQSSRCYRLKATGTLCGTSQTSMQMLDCPNCPGMPTCPQCSGPAWEVYPTPTYECDLAVGTGYDECLENEAVFAQKHFFYCNGNNCYTFSHSVDFGTSCNSAKLGGDLCTP
jgi:hypothetical protein